MASKILLSVFSLVITLILTIGIIEVKTRWDEGVYLKDMQAKYEGRELCLRASQDPILIYELTPNKCDHNSLGFRDVEHTKAKPRGTFRIGVIGDSVTEGVGVEIDESYPRVLENILVDSGYRVEVLKFAVRGYATTQELVLLQQALKFDLDLVVWSYVLNDPAHPIYHAVNAEMDRYFYKPDSYFVHWIKRKLFFADQRSRSKGCNEEYHAKLHCQYKDVIEQQLNSIALKTVNIPVLMLIHPVFEQDGFDRYELTTVHADLADMANSAHLYPVDILDDYKNLPNSVLKRSEAAGEWFDPWHPNATGHRIIAERIAKELRKGHFLED
jgi:lysophospholipase L1-like esterase